MRKSQEDRKFQMQQTQAAANFKNQLDELKQQCQLNPDVQDTRDGLRNRFGRRSKTVCSAIRAIKSEGQKGFAK